MNNNPKTGHCSGILFLGLLAAAVATSGFSFPEASASRGTSVNLSMPGPQVEKSHAAFAGDRKEAIARSDGWIFAAEEFSCPADIKENTAGNMQYVAGVHNMLTTQNTQLIVVLIPAKARVMKEHLGKNAMPACRAGLYDESTEFFSVRNIPATDLLPAMMAPERREAMFLKGDSQWTPEGAKIAAAVTATTAHDKGIFGAGTLHYATVAIPVSARASAGIATYQTVAQVSVASASPSVLPDIFGDDTPVVTLVGTSYSANAVSNFAGFLKEYLHADVLNAAEEDQGPFAAMDKFLESDAFKSAPPKLVVWEIPESYLAFPHGVVPEQ